MRAVALVLAAAASVSAATVPARAIVCLSRDCRVSLQHPTTDQIAAAHAMNGVFVAEAATDSTPHSASGGVSGACNGDRASRGRCGARAVAVPLAPTSAAFVASMEPVVVDAADVAVSSIDVVLGAASEDAPPQRARAVISLWPASNGDARGQPLAPVGDAAFVWRPPVRVLCCRGTMLCRQLVRCLRSRRARGR